MALGDITVEIDPAGWAARLKTAGFVPGATYAFGLRGELPGAISGRFADGETITQATTGATAKVVGNQSGGTKLLVELPTGSANATNNWTGANGTLVPNDLAYYNIPGPNTPYLDVVRLQDDPTSPGTVTDRVYMTAVIRFPYNTKYIAGSYSSGTFADGETVTQGTTGATGIVVGAQSAGGRLYVTEVTGSPDNNGAHTWVGGTSGAVFAPSAVPSSAIAVPTKDEKDDGTALNCWVALSEYIYQKDNTGGGNSGTAPVVTIPAGFITNSGGGAQSSNALSAAAVTQSSTAAYPYVLGNWSWPGFMRYDGTNPPRVVAFHRSARNGCPVRLVRFTVTDGTHTYNEDVTTPIIDPSMGDAEPVVEYIPTGNYLNTMDQGAVLTWNFTAYGFYGDSSATLTSVGGTAAPTPLVGPITGICDKTGAYGRPFAVVDAAAADDTSGTIVNRMAYASDALAEAACVPYKTIGKAMSAIATYANSNLSRNTVAAGEVACIAGSYNFAGSSNSYGTTPDCWGIIRAATGVSASSVLMSGSSGNTSISGRIQFKNVQFTSSTNSTFRDAAYWIANCDFNTTAAACWNTTAQVVRVTHCTTTAFTQGFRASSTGNIAFALVRGCNLNGFNRTIHCYTVLGNVKHGNTAPASSPLLIEQVSGGTAPVATNVIVAFNRFYGWNSTGSIGVFGALANSLAPVRGMAMVQNLFEGTGTVGPSELMPIGASESLSTNTPYDNVLLWHNIWVGQRQNFAYNSSDALDVLKHRRQWQIKNCIFNDFNLKTDDFITTGLNGKLTGNWPVYYSVGFSGNLLVKRGDGFENAFVGLNTKATADWNDDLAFWRFVDFQAALDTVADTGDGDYRNYTASPIMRTQRDWILKYGFGGKPRSANGESCGPFAEGGTRQASMAFGG